MPARRAAGCVSTAWYQPTCAMRRIRPAGRQAGPRPMKRSPRAPLRRRLKALGAAVETPRRSVSVPVRRSAGCVSTAWYQPTCAMQKVRCSDRQAPDLDVTVASVRDVRTAGLRGYVRSDRNLDRTSSASRAISRQNNRRIREYPCHTPEMNVRSQTNSTMFDDKVRMGQHVHMQPSNASHRAVTQCTRSSPRHAFTRTEQTAAAGLQCTGSQRSHLRRAAGHKSTRGIHNAIATACHRCADARGAMPVHHRPPPPNRAEAGLTVR